jgi:hypothetical protein
VSYAALRAAMHPHLMRVPVSELALCPDCGEFYEKSYTFYCPQSDGQESDDAQCPTTECRESREVSNGL